MKKIIIIIISFLIGFIFNLLLNSIYFSESRINRIVENQNLYCEGGKMFWGKFENNSLEYCSDFKGIEIKTKRLILPCE